MAAIVLTTLCLRLISTYWQSLFARVFIEDQVIVDLAVQRLPFPALRRLPILRQLRSVGRYGHSFLPLGVAAETHRATLRA